MSTNRGSASHETLGGMGIHEQKEIGKGGEKKKLTVMCLMQCHLAIIMLFNTHIFYDFCPLIGYIFRRFHCVGVWLGVQCTHHMEYHSTQEDQAEICTHTQADGLCYYHLFGRTFP